mmetsp:Transcript_64509/g.181494  ORF Transcript_64509/g.181494 Transcript_64509/m.181494 type:complete len:226 (-) Transcript_64509:303-980(-)
MTSSASSLRSSVSFMSGERRPAASYGNPRKTSPSSGTPLRQGGTKYSPLPSGGGTSRCITSATTRKKSSQRPKTRSVASPSWTVRCRPTITAPSASPLAAAAAGHVTTRSAFRPQTDVPTATERSAVSAQATMSRKSTSGRLPDMGTTGLSGENHDPCTSLMSSCGKPAFCGSPSWFCWIQRYTLPALQRATRTWCACVGCARNGDIGAATWPPTPLRLSAACEA